MCAPCERGLTGWDEPSQPAQSEPHGEHTEALDHTYTIDAATPSHATCGEHHLRAYPRSRLSMAMSPTWIWMQIAIVVFVVIGMIVAITKLA